MQNNCIQYNNEDRLITISCSKPLHLKDVYDRLQGSNVLEYKEDSGYKIWILNAGILINKGSTFIIDSTDTTWLKIVTDGTHGYPISVLGSLKIDSVGISSWDPKTNDYVRFKFDVRPDDGADYTGVDTVPDHLLEWKKVRQEQLILQIQNLHISDTKIKMTVTVGLVYFITEEMAA